MRIYVNRQGGLGNQLFQVAHGMAQAKKYNAELSISQQTTSGRSPFNTTLFSDFNKYKTSNCSIVRETQFEFRGALQHNSVDTEYHGYFQSDKYFSEITDEVRVKFTRPTDVYIPRDKKVPNVAMHIRRGDYLQFPNHHPNLGMNDYYLSAIKYMSDHINGPFTLVLFSDDIPWCRQHVTLKSLIPIAPNLASIVYMDKRLHVPIDENVLIDLYNMSLCDHYIMANSSFSWWGTFLSTLTDKLITAPKQWFGPSMSFKTWSTVYLPGSVIL